MVKEITVDSFNTEVINSDKLTVVDFYATCAVLAENSPLSLRKLKPNLATELTLLKLTLMII